MCYFPLDVRFFENDKIEFIMAKFGLRGVSIVIRLLCDIYANGYYIRWDDDKCRLMSRKLGARNGQFVSQVVQGLLEIGFFDAESYTKHGILTSKSAQEVYLDYVRKCKLEEIQDSDYLIIEPIQKRKHTKREKQIDEKRDSKGETNNSPYNINKIKGNKIEKEEKNSSSSEEEKEVVVDVDAFGGKNLNEKKNLKSYRLELLGNDSWCRSIAQLSGQEELSYRELPQVMELFELHIATQNCENEIFSGNEYARRFTNWWRCLGFRSAENIRKVNLSRGDRLLSRCETRANRPSKVEQAMEVSKQVSENVKKLLGYV
jgi:hypothetical protein